MLFDIHKTSSGIVHKYPGFRNIEVFGVQKYNHTIISDTIALEDGLLKLTGGVTFYKSDVIFNKVVLDATKAEDALNIIHSEFKLDDITILSSISDGFDADFSQGTITNSSFDRIGGDALDFSGSKVYITNTDIKNVVDKAISVGEASKVKVERGYVDKVGVAFASKDGSEAFISGVTVGSVTLSVAMTFGENKSLKLDASAKQFFLVELFMYNFI